MTAESREDWTRTDLVEALIQCKLEPGDTVLVHSSISGLGRLENDTVKDYLEAYHGALQEVLGESGTIVVPAYYYEYARKKKPFDLKRSPVSAELGLFARYINAQKGSLRSLNPLTSLAAVGKNAEFICGGKTGASYGVDSGYDRLTQIKAKMAFIGVDLSVMTYIHYVEYRVGVPHLYSKCYDIPVYDDGKKIDIPISGQVRYLDFNIQNDSQTNTVRYEESGVVRKAKVGDGAIRIVKMAEIFDYLKTKIQQDFSYDLKRTPNFDPEKIPLI